ncbi:gluconolaconase [Leptolyngbya sp. NK1-12]|uniref:Vgb family protein n=1 Tax=Leptolyngbya sp. NK1-12 TaxID=2547451 RepID=UPI0029318A01|nr:gluconolaconase [Leptolyngbya sp. NK1-12]
MRKLSFAASALLLPILSVINLPQSALAFSQAFTIETSNASQSVNAISQNTPANILTAIELPANFQYPNGIAHASDGTVYVGSITSGRILRISPNGDIETLFPGNDEVFAATSLRLDEPRGILWGSSPDFLGTRTPNGETVRRAPRVFAIDIRSGEVLRLVSMPEGGFSNDLAVDPEGGVYITDSTLACIHYLAPGATQLQTWAADERFQDDRIGLGGIARRSDGVLIVGHYSNGSLFQVTPQPQGQPMVTAIPLERPLENPDGMQFAPDGSLILTEGAMTSGKGQLLRINVFAPGTHPKSIETLASELKSPVNLTLVGTEIWVTESQIRHRLIPEEEGNIPDRFFIRRFGL